MSRKRRRGVAKIVRLLEQGEPVIVTKKTYSALIPYLKRLRQRGYRVVVTHFFNEDRYIISTGGFIIGWKFHDGERLLDELEASF